MRKYYPKQLVKPLVCLKDKQGLIIGNLEKAADDGITEGELVCPVCHSRYPIRQGILDFSNQQNELPEEMRIEVAARDQAAGGYDKKLASRYYREIPSTLKALGDFRGQRIIEYGCGTGRLTAELAGAEQFLAIDFSRASLLKLQEKISGPAALGAALGDIVQFKTAPDYFDLALSAQVIEHIPDAAKRREFFENVRETLKSGGKFVCTAYHYDYRRRRAGQPQEGFHPSGIFYHYFTGKELKQELSAVFPSVKIKLIDISWLLVWRLGLPARFEGSLSRLAERLPGIRQLGHLVLAEVRKR